MSSYIGTFLMWNQFSACFSFTWPEKLHPFLCAIYLDLVSYLMEHTGTGQVNVTCPVGSTLSWSAEFKHRNISANAVHIWGDWQHLKDHWVKGERQSCGLRDAHPTRILRATFAWHMRQIHAQDSRRMHASHPRIRRKCCAHLPREERATRDVNILALCVCNYMYVAQHVAKCVHSKNKGTTGVLWRCNVSFAAILVPLGYYSKKSKPESPWNCNRFNVVNAFTSFQSLILTQS
jgi:hypothetical protein